MITSATVAAGLGYNEVSYIASSSYGGSNSYVFLNFATSSAIIDGDLAKPVTVSDPFLYGGLFSINESIIGGEPIPVFRTLSFDVSKLTTENPGYAMSPVSLPSSAPMFGAALLSLAGLGYAAKRKIAATAA